MMTDIILLGVICLGLGLYCLKLLAEIRFLKNMVVISVKTMHELADGTMEVKKVDGRIKLSSSITSGDRYES
jgi:hypothetical protein